MLSREVFISFYGLGFWLLSLQVIGVFVVFRRFPYGSRRPERRRPRGGAPRPWSPLGGRPSPSRGRLSLSKGLLSF